MAEHYVLPSELVALVAFWFVPPLLIACGAQAWFFAARGTFRSHRRRAVGALVATVLTSIVLGVGLLLASPEFLPRWLGVTHVSFGGQSLPMLPLSFVTVVLIAPIFAYLGVRHAHAGA
jgi:hypothetical protein